MPRDAYIVTIGLEAHVQLKTRSKLFCSCPVRFGDEPNTLVCPVCLGLPGSLPVLNQAAVEKTILAGLMLGCAVPPLSKWDRKNYFYPDMPKNYQISQYDLPLCTGGSVPLYDLAYPKDAQNAIAFPGKTVKLTRIHLEEDVAKSTHHAASTTIDFNRAGLPLMEIVSEPEIASPEEAFAYLSSLRQILVYGDLSDADMEKGQMRCDVNVSVRRRAEDPLGAKIELKNLNSISGVRRALRYEIERQIDDLESGRPLTQSTRRWDDDLGQTFLMRSKEHAHDYRYFPDPDLLPLETKALVGIASQRIPELPHAKRERFEREYGLSPYDAGVLASDRFLADYFESAAEGVAKAKGIANWIINDLLSALNASGRPLAECPLPPGHIRELTGLTEEGSVSVAQAREVFAVMFESGGDPRTIARERGLEQVSDTGTLEQFVEQVLAENPSVAGDARSGNDKSLNYLIGQVMKLSRGAANPKKVSELLRERVTR